MGRTKEYLMCQWASIPQGDFIYMNSFNFRNKNETLQRDSIILFNRKEQT